MTALPCLSPYSEMGVPTQMNNWRMFFQFVFPSVIAFALSRIYTIVDGFFVGRSLGDMGLAAINLGFSISAFMQAVGTGIGLSDTIRFTILRGQKKQGKVKECFTSTAFLLGLASVALMALMLVFLMPLLCLLGRKANFYR